jgi:hypothetical protein
VTLTVNVDFFGAPAPANYEWRLYVDDVTPGIIGTTDLDGAESETGTVLTYQYDYTSDITSVLQIIADGFVEPRPLTITLGNLDQTVNVTIDADTNI